MDPGTAAAVQLVLTLQASWSGDARALILFRDNSWLWPEVVAQPDLQDTAGLPCLLLRATELLRASLGLAPYTPLRELSRAYDPRALVGASVTVAYRSHVEAADGVVVPYMGPGAHWLSLEEVLDVARDPRPGLLAFARLAAVGAGAWTRPQELPPVDWLPTLLPLAAARASSTLASDSDQAQPDPPVDP